MPGDALVINDTAYAGSAASYMITRAVIGADTIEKGCIYVEDGIKKERTIPRIEVSGFMQKRAASPSPKGTVTVDGQVLVPQDIMLFYLFNPRDYEVHWYAEQLKPQLLARDLPQTAESFMVMQQMKRLNEWFELAIWRSRKDYDTDPGQPGVDPTTKGADAGDAEYFYFDGLIKKLLDAVTVPPVGQRTILVSSPATLVAGVAGGGQENIGDALQRAYAIVPKALLFKYGVTGLKVLVSYGTQQIYEQFLTTQTFKNNDTTEKGINRYKGYDVVPLAGMPDNTFIFCYAMPSLESNTWLGINSTEDNKLELAKYRPEDERYFIKGLFKMDTQIGFPDQAVLYTTLVA